MADDARERLEATIAAMEAALAEIPIPIYGIKPNKVPWLAGSAFILRIADHRFFVTAAHVLNEKGDKGLHVPGPVGLQQLAMQFYRTKIDKVHGFDFDLAFNVVPPHLEKACSRYDPVEIASVDPNHIPSTDTIYSFLGCPSTQNKAKLNTKTLEPTILPYQAVTLPESDYENCGLNTSIHIAVGFDQPNTKYPDGTIRTPPDPKGISGCSVWSLGRLPEIDSGKARAKLVAVGIAHMKHPERLEATRIAMLLECIRQIFPDLAGHIPASKFLGASVRVEE